MIRTIYKNAYEVAHIWKNWAHETWYCWGFKMYFMYLLKILLHHSTPKFGSEIHIPVHLVFRYIRYHISMSTILCHSMAYIKSPMVMESILPISYSTPGMFFWGWIHHYWNYITISSYSILGYLNNFSQCLHWFYPPIHLGFHPLSFLLLLILVSSSVQIINHKLDYKYLKN